MMNFRILKKEKPLYSRNIIFSGMMDISFLNRMGGRGCSPATPAAEGVPHGGMGGARTDGGHPVTGPILKKIIPHGKKGDTFVLESP